MELVSFISASMQETFLVLWEERLPNTSQLPDVTVKGTGLLLQFMS